MPRKKVSFDTVREIARELPGAEESTSYGSPAIKVGGKLLACLPSHKSAEPDSLVVRTDFIRRDELIAEAPEIYYTKPHYQGYASVLVRLNKIDRDALRDLLKGSLRFVTARKR